MFGALKEDRKTITNNTPKDYLRKFGNKRDFK